eukprot:324309_1
MTKLWIQKKQWSTIQMILVLSMFGLVQYFVYIFYLYPDVDNSNIRKRSLLTSVGIEHKTYEFGHKARQHFVMDPEYMPFQFGSYGYVPEEVIQSQIEHRYEIEWNPDIWMLETRNYHFESLLKEMCDYLGIKNVKDLMFIINASSGINAVFNSIVRYKQLYTSHDCGTYGKEPCKILRFNTAFETIINHLDHINSHPDSTANQIITFNVTRDMLSNTELLISKLKLYLDKNHKHIILATFDHAESFPNTIFDAKRLCALFRSYDILTFVDAAQAMGQIDVDIGDIDPDMWLSNGHKWLSSIKGSSVLYVRENLHDVINPVLITNRWDKSQPIQQKFNWQGTMDDSLWLSLKAALDFRRKFGDEAIKTYSHSLAMEAGEVITKIWKTELLVYNEDNIGSTINPILPDNYIKWDDDMAALLYELLWLEYNTIVYIKKFEDVNKVYYCPRIMVTIFHEIEDFVWFAEKTLEILERIRDGYYQDFDVEIDPDMQFMN